VKITLVEFSPSGGLLHFAVQLGEALADRGHDVELITGWRPELRSGVPGFRVRGVLPTWHPPTGRSMPRALQKLRRATRAVRYYAAWPVVAAVLARRRPDVVQWASLRFPVDGWWVHRLIPEGRRISLDLVHAPRPFNEQLRSGEVFRMNPRLRRSLARAYTGIDAVLVLGEQSRVDMASAWPEVRRVHVVPHGDESVFARTSVPGPPSAAPARVLFFGTLTTYKGLDLLLDAFALVRADDPHVELVIAGAPSADIDLDQLRRRGEAIGGVCLRPGYVALPAVAELFAGARVVVAPYRYANASGVVHLAQTFGRPVVATRVGDLPAALADGTSGWLVPPGDARALATALQRLLRDPAEADRLGAAGRKRLNADASWPVVAARFEEVYRECLADR